MAELNDLQRYFAAEFAEEYRVGHMSRREALKRLAYLTGSMASASAFLAACSSSATSPDSRAGAPTSAPASPTAGAASNPTTAASATTAPNPVASPTTTAATTPRTAPGTPVPESDPDIQAMMAELPGDGFTLRLYAAQPRASGNYPGLIVIHENRGLVDHIKDVTRRFAKEGYVAVAPDLVSRQGGTTGVSDPAQIPQILSGGISPDQLVSDLNSALTYLKGLSATRKDRLGVTGYCFGGGMTWRLAFANPEIKAAVPFYGPNPSSLDDVPKTNAAIFAVYGGDDRFVNGGIPAMEDALKKTNKTYQIKIYEGAPHAFHNDTGPSYRPEQAKAAYNDTLAWFSQYLKS